MVFRFKNGSQILKQTEAIKKVVKISITSIYPVTTAGFMNVLYLCCPIVIINNMCYICVVSYTHMFFSIIERLVKMRAIRQKKLEQLLFEREYLSVQDISDEFDVHINTVRKDINELVKKGIAEKRYGGIARSTSMVPTSFVDRLNTNRTLKESIGKKASSFLEENDVVFVDSGTTAAMIICGEHVLPNHLTIITNNLHIINWSLSHTEYTVFALPGKVDWQLNALASIETIESIKIYNIKKAIIGCRRVTKAGSLTSASAIDARIKESAISLCQQAFLLADSQKIGSPELFTFSSLDKMDYWISDDNIVDAEYYAQKFNIKIV